MTSPLVFLLQSLAVLKPTSPLVFLAPAMSTLQTRVEATQAHGYCTRLDRNSYITERDLKCNAEVRCNRIGECLVRRNPEKKRSIHACLHFLFSSLANSESDVAIMTSEDAEGFLDSAVRPWETVEQPISSEAPRNRVQRGPAVATPAQNAAQNTATPPGLAASSGGLGGALNLDLRAQRVDSVAPVAAEAQGSR